MDKWKKAVTVRVRVRGGGGGGLCIDSDVTGSTGQAWTFAPAAGPGVLPCTKVSAY
jgi:hypothetical protein